MTFKSNLEPKLIRALDLKLVFIARCPVCLSVCLSVTRRCYVKTAKCISKLIRPISQFIS